MKKCSECKYYKDIIEGNRKLYKRDLERYREYMSFLMEQNSSLKRRLRRIRNYINMFKIVRRDS